MTEGIQGRRVRKGKGLESISRDALQDPRLSFKATGILSYLLSLPDNWRTDAERLSKAKNGAGKVKEGRESIQAGLRELEDTGYLVRRKYQAEGGRWAWIWRYSDDPADLQEQDVSAGQTGNGLPGIGSSGDGSPDYIEVLDVKVLDVDKSKPPSADADGDAGLFVVPDEPPAKSRKTKPGQEELDSSFEAFWKVYPRKIGKKAARLRWAGAVKKLSSAKLIKAAELYAGQRAGQDQTYTAHAATWLNQERWADETGNGPGSGADHQSVKAWLVEQHQAGRAKPVEERSGLRYYPPPLPDDVTTIEQGAAFHAARIREWIKTNHEQIIQKVLDREGRGAAAS